ncbi:hypothetical protein DPMN_068041 [Dreissena polymorpha]|uniref:Uncharacterized protein n=1 Tax=Dreissena polymorpha TaxID=45954 RepID=A0A9D4BLV0_DREPO|nr:hypothetical protein DPMN_068041 [Dreissena polymorpha]
MQFKKCDFDFETLFAMDVDQIELTVDMEAQYKGAIDENAGVSFASQFGCFDSNVVDSDSLYYDLGEDLNVTLRRSNAKILPQKEVDNYAYFESIRKLNDEQQHFF